MILIFMGPWIKKKEIEDIALLLICLYPHFNRILQYTMVQNDCYLIVYKLHTYKYEMMMRKHWCCNSIVFQYFLSFYHFLYIFFCFHSFHEIDLMTNRPVYISYFMKSFLNFFFLVQDMHVSWFNNIDYSEEIFFFQIVFIQNIPKGHLQRQLHLQHIDLHIQICQLVH